MNINDQGSKDQDQFATTAPAAPAGTYSAAPYPQPPYLGFAPGATGAAPEPAPGIPPSPAPYFPGPQLLPVQQPARRFWPILLAIVAVVLLGCAGPALVLGLSLNEVSGEVAKMGSNREGKNATEGRFNEPATDGVLQFTVVSRQCGQTQVGQEPDVSIARGEFCTFGVKVVNAGKQAGDFHAMSQYAYDARGAEYSTDLSATYSSNRGNSVTSDQLNPGASLEATLVFDVPRGTVLTHLILHESYFSPGVKVALG